MEVVLYGQDSTGCNSRGWGEGGCRGTGNSSGLIERASPVTAMAVGKETKRDAGERKRAVFSVVTQLLRVYLLRLLCHCPARLLAKP